MPNQYPPRVLVALVDDPGTGGWAGALPRRRWVVLLEPSKGWLQPQLAHNWKIIVGSAHSTACRGPSGTEPSSAIKADALTSVRAIRAADKVTYIDHFGGDSEGPVSTAVLARHFIQNFGRRPMKKNLS